MIRSFLLLLGLFAVCSAFADDQPKYDETFYLAPGKILLQADTRLCWAFTAFHMLRLYYEPAANKSADAERWRAYFKQYEDGDKLLAHLKEKFDANYGGWPMQAMSLFEQEAKATAHPWAAFVPTTGTAGWRKHSDQGLVAGDFSAYFESADKIVTRVHDSLKAGVPVGYCSVYHCGTLIGAAYVKGKPYWYAMTDSLHAESFWFPAADFDNWLADVTALWK